MLLPKKRIPCEGVTNPAIPKTTVCPGVHCKNPGHYLGCNVGQKYLSPCELMLFEVVEAEISPGRTKEPLKIHSIEHMH